MKCVHERNPVDEEKQNMNDGAKGKWQIGRSAPTSRPLCLSLAMILRLLLAISEEEGNLQIDDSIFWLSLIKCSSILSPLPVHGNDFEASFSYFRGGR